MLTGVHTIMPTPFTPTGDLDLPSLTKLTRFLIGLGVDGVVVLGVMGEAPKLSTREQQDVIRTTVEAAAGRVPVFAGSGAEGTRLAAEKSLAAVEAGASGLLVAPPGVQNDAVIFEYYREVNDAVNCPIILHDYPAATGVRMSVPLVVQMAEALGNVQVIKLEEPPSGPKVSQLKAQRPELSVMGGLGGMYFLQELQRGSDGIMTGFSYPEVLLSIYRAYTSGAHDEAARIFFQAAGLLTYEFQPGIGLAVRKEIYRLRGAIGSAYVRHPGAQIQPELQRELRQAVASAKLEESLQGVGN
ncbi:dihydrodipicolinate synthase family protein [Deinococcus sp. UYEF24]